MSTVAEITSTPSVFADRSRRAFLVRKLHSLTGVVPVGVFMLFHLWTNALALQGQDRYDKAVSDINHMPYVWAIEIGGILVPLAFHALYGVKLALEGRPNVGHYTFSRNWMYTMQRLTGVVAFAFIGYHLWEYWGQKLVGKMASEQFYPMLCANMSSTYKGVPLVALVYLIGVAASVFHFANGLWGFCFSWGITVSRRSQRLAAGIFGIVGVVVFLLGANTAIYFATGSRFAIPNHLIGAAPPGEHAIHTCADVPSKAAAEAVAK